MRMRALAVLALLFSFPARAETITVAADVWCPYTCAEGGYMLEIARDIFQKNHIEMDYRVEPWAQALEKTREGEYDAVIGAAKADAPDFIFPSMLQGLSNMQFWVLEGNGWNYEGIESLAKIRLGVVQDYAYSKALNDYILANQNNEDRIAVVKGNNALAENLNRLKSGAIDVLVEDENVVNYYLASQAMDIHIRMAGSPVPQEDREANYLRIAFSPKNPKAQEYAAMLDAGMKELRRSGELAKILDLYHVSDWYGITKE